MGGLSFIDIPSSVLKEWNNEGDSDANEEVAISIQALPRYIWPIDRLPCNANLTDDPLHRPSSALNS